MFLRVGLLPGQGTNYDTETSNTTKESKDALVENLCGIRVGYRRAALSGGPRRTHMTQFELVAECRLRRNVCNTVSISV